MANHGKNKRGIGVTPLSSILKALKKIERAADTPLGMPAGIIEKPTDRPGIRPVIVKSLIIVTALAIFAAVGFIINRKPAISTNQSPAIKTDQIRKESLSQQPVELRIKTPIPMSTTPSPSNEPAKPLDIIEKPQPIGIDEKTVKPDDAHKRVERPPVSTPKSKAYYSEPTHSDVQAPTEIMEINDNIGLKLQAISWSMDANKRMVVINGQICREGERVKGYIVKQINQADVIISNGSMSGKLFFKIR